MLNILDCLESFCCFKGLRNVERGWMIYAEFENG